MSYPPMPYGQSQTTFVVGRPHYSGGHIALAWVLTVLSAGYLLPWAIAVTRQRPNISGLVLIDIFLGWTFIGWVAALIMACTDDRSATVTVVHNTYFAPQAYPSAPPAYAPPPPLPYDPRAPGIGRAVGSGAASSAPTASDPTGYEPTARLEWDQPGREQPGHWR